MGIDVQVSPKLLNAHIVNVYPLGFAISLQYIYDLSKKGFISLVHNTTEGFAHNLPTYHYDISTKANSN